MKSSAVFSMMWWKITEYTFDDLLEAGIPERIVETLSLLTHEKGNALHGLHQAHLRIRK